MVVNGLGKGESTGARKKSLPDIRNLEICVEHEDNIQEWLLSEGWQNVTPSGCFWLNQPKRAFTGDWAHPFSGARAATEQSDHHGTETREQMRASFSGALFQLVDEERVTLDTRTLQPPMKSWIWTMTANGHHICAS